MRSLCSWLCLGLVVAVLVPGCDDEPGGAAPLPTCRSPRRICDGSCVDVTRDQAHCGRCENACGADEICQESRCELSCGTGVAQCPGGCRDLTIDPSNCGECGRPCIPGQACRDGECVSLCAPGTILCNGVCRDFATDPENCGSCNHRCEAGEVCSRGVCTLVCPSGLIECDGACHDLTSDPDNCGACFHVCAAGEVCRESVCALICPPAMFQCEGVCVNLDSDPVNCGVCGLGCAVGEVCSEGHCRITCGGDLVDCSGSCTNLDHDPSNCGECGTTCAAPRNAFAVCVRSDCDFTCADGFEDCNRASLDGCEAALSTDLANCGTCGNRCGAGPRSEASCTDGRCDLTCEEGYAFCSSDPRDGCTDTLIDPINCGECSTVCGEGESCRDGECRVLGPTREEVLAARAIEDDWLRASPYGDKHDGGWVYSARENVLYAIYGNANSGRNVYRIDHIGRSYTHVATLSYGRHGSHPVLDDAGRFVYFPPSQETNQLERLDTTTFGVSVLAPAPTSGTFAHGDWKNGRLWIVLNDGWLHAYDADAGTWQTNVQSYGSGAGMVVAHANDASDDIYVWNTNETFWAYNTVTGVNRSLARFSVDAALGGNGQIVYVPSADGLEYGFVYAVSGCGGSPRIYSVHDDAWYPLADPHDNGSCNGHATYDSTARRLYVTDASHRVWYYQY